MVKVTFAFKTRRGVVQKNEFSYLTDPGDQERVLLQRCDSLEDEHGSLISTNHSHHCHDSFERRQRHNEALVQSVREKLNLVHEDHSRKTLGSISNFYRKFKRKFRYRRLPSVYSFNSLNN